MVCFPNCKINLGLHIDGRRTDGFHNIETVFYPLPLHDVVEVIAADQFIFLPGGMEVPGRQGDNLCVRAYWLLKKDFPGIQPVHLFLYKGIPMGAGLGGGSADGAFTLLLLNTLFQLNLSSEQLAGYALQLGSDCPFFMIDKPCLASGRGEILEQIPVDLSAYSFLLVHPPVHIDTGLAFSQVKPPGHPVPLKELIMGPLSGWSQVVKNDFEETMCARYPDLKMIKEKLVESGALYASMTGSGSAFFGIFEKHQVPSISFEKDFSVFVIK